MDSWKRKILDPRAHSAFGHDGRRSAWAARYEPGDVLHYIRGSKDIGIEAGSYAQVVATLPKTISSPCGSPTANSSPMILSRLRGISAYREIERDFAIGDRVQLTAPNRIFRSPIATSAPEQFRSRWTAHAAHGWRQEKVTFDPLEMRHFDHGYAVTSHSSQGLTSERVLVNMDTEVHPELINGRFAYVSVSRASHDAQIFTNDAANLAESLSRGCIEDFGDRYRKGQCACSRTLVLVKLNSAKGRPVRVWGSRCNKPERSARGAFNRSNRLLEFYHLALSRLMFGYLSEH